MKAPFDMPIPGTLKKCKRFSFGYRILSFISSATSAQGHIAINYSIFSSSFSFRAVKIEYKIVNIL